MFYSSTGALDTTASNITIYGWDNANELVSVKTFAGYSDYATYLSGTEAPSSEVDYTYDAFGMKVSRTTKDSTGTIATNENYINDGQNLALVLNSAGAVIERELYGPAVDQVFASEVVGSNAYVSGGFTGATQAAGTVNWFFTDNQGSVRDVIQATVVSGGTSDAYVVATDVDNINYDPYGNVVYQSASSAQPCFLYNGMQYDAATGMYYSVRRWYDPVNGNWLSQDPIGFAGGQTNTSEFVGNSPTNGIDPSGMNDSLSFSGAGSKSFPAPAPPDCTLVVPNTPITASMIDLAAQKASAGLPAYVGSVSGPGSGGGAPRPVGLAEGAWLSTYVVWGNYARSIFKTGGKIIETFSLGNLQPNKSQFMKDRDDYMDYAYKRLNMTGPDSPFNLRTNIETFTNLLSAYFFLSGEGEGAGADTTVGGDFVEGDMNGGSFDDPSAIGDPVSSAQAAPTDILPGGTPAPDGGGTIPPSPNMPNGGWYRENPHSFGGDVIEYPTYPSGVPPQSVPPTWRLPPAPQPPAFPPGVPRLTPQRPWWPPQAGNG